LRHHALLLFAAYASSTWIANYWRAQVKITVIIAKVAAESFLSGDDEIHGKLRSVMKLKAKPLYAFILLFLLASEIVLAVRVIRELRTIPVEARDQMGIWDWFALDSIADCFGAQFTILLVGLLATVLYFKARTR
jgi:hypothetical protein